MECDFWNIQYKVCLYFMGSIMIIWKWRSALDWPIIYLINQNNAMACSSTNLAPLSFFHREEWEYDGTMTSSFFNLMHNGRRTFAISVLEREREREREKQYPISTLLSLLNIKTNRNNSMIILQLVSYCKEKRRISYK